MVGEMAYDGNIGPQKMELTQVIREPYIKALQPYEDKVLHQKKTLTSQELTKLEGIKSEITDKYNNDDSLTYELLTYINGIMQLDEVRKKGLKEDELDKKVKELSLERAVLAQSGRLTPKKEKEINREINEANYFLDPSHFHG